MPEFIQRQCSLFMSYGVYNSNRYAHFQKALKFINIMCIKIFQTIDLLKTVENMYESD